MANEVLKNPLSEDFRDAFEYANRMHRTQSRKGTQIPYIAHPLAVAALVLEDGGSEAEAIAALLHDVLEDGEGTRPERAAYIAANFGDGVLALVEGCSEAETDRERGPENWLQRKRDYIASLKNERPEVLRVSLADKVHNARAILRDYQAEREALWARFNCKDGNQQMAYYRDLADQFMALKCGPMAEELNRIVEELERERSTAAG